MRRTLARLAVVGVTGAVVMAPIAALAETTLVTFKDTNGCTHKVWGPTVTVTTLPNPGVGTAGGFGESVSCP